jgi:hypothetical protein
VAVTLTQITTDEQAVAGLTCRLYRRRDGRHSPTPDPDDLRESIARLLPPPTQES